MEAISKKNLGTVSLFGAQEHEDPVCVLKVNALIYAIESMKAVSGPQQVKSLEHLVENFEKDISEWCHLS